MASLNQIRQMRQQNVKLSVSQNSFYIQIMILERFTFESEGNSEAIEQQLEQYKHINKGLRRKIKEKDMKIMQLFSYIDQASRQATMAPTPQLIKEKSRQRSIKLAFSQNNKKGKENSIQHQLDSSNIFKQQSFSLMSRNSRNDMHLPVLQRKNKILYPLEDSIFQNPQAKCKVIRIPFQRLRPLDSKQVKRRFLMKFQKKDFNTEQTA